MKKILKIMLFIVFTLNFLNVNAENTKEKEKINNKSIVEDFTKWDLNFKNFTIENSLVFFSKFYENTTPESYKYIKLNFIWIKEWSDLEKALKILVYNNKINNFYANFSWKEKNQISFENFYKLAEKIIWVYSSEDTIKTLSSERNLDYTDLEIIEQAFKNQKSKIEFEKYLNTKKWDKSIIDNVYNILINDYYDKSKLDKEKLIYSAVEWMTKSIWDKHTVFFPPKESKDFLWWLNWDFEWIWTYVEMPEPWIFKITSPIVWWPAEKAWIKWWDLIVEVDWKKITKENSQSEIISWIKWPEWTEVNLKINRNWDEFYLKVKREKVHLKSIESYFNWNNYVIKISWFNEWVSREFVDAIEILKQKNGIKKIVFDLRNNWGWFLNEVVSILSNFVPKWEPTAIVKYTVDEWKFLSKWNNLIDFSKYELVFLQNSETASASEIMIWTLKDYYKNLKIVWEKSYGKWSVQTIKEFDDWSSIKYTTAKWFTWKTKTWIDWIGILPTIEIKLNEELYKNQKIDNQLQKALSI